LSGSYPFAEIYNTDIRFYKIVEAIKQMKEEDSTLTPKEIIDVGGTVKKLTEYTNDRPIGHINETDFSFNFYIEDRNELYNIVVRKIEGGIKTRILLNFVCEGNDFRTGKRINEDWLAKWSYLQFNTKENRERKKFFEENILKEIIRRAEKIK
jgi:hypothetical protein